MHKYENIKNMASSVLSKYGKKTSFKNRYAFSDGIIEIDQWWSSDLDNFALKFHVRTEDGKVTVLNEYEIGLKKYESEYDILVSRLNLWINEPIIAKLTSRPISQ